ncbi:beta-glucuronidase [Staphylococcus caledonicus]|uniref:beta-glucuronidase n=1 Tax=Staphylococcus sp. acrmy TaxID=2929076 RepID=UPI001F5A34B1|nr:beta-glucuronidase [Staphylococcus sp. acrmy]MCI2948765.1 beta-glucuronidase [Staphylococcus sp. acrmy]
MLYPIVTETRTVIDLSGIWNFKLENAQNINDVQTPLETEYVMAVPGSYNDQGIVDKIRNHVGDVWYEREFTIPKSFADDRVVLRFASATHQATVYVDGKEVVSHSGGFLPFEVKLTGELASTGSYRLSVKVNNVLDYSTLPVGNYSEEKDENGEIVRKNNPNFDFFNYAGLHRPVKIYTTPQNYIEDIEIITNVLNDDKGEVSYKIKGQFPSNTHVRVSVIDEKGNNVASANQTESTIEIEHAHLWQPLNAYMYDLKVEIFDNDEQLIDSYSEPFGIRSVEVKNGQFLINNKPFYFKGFGKHEDTFYSGRGLNETANVLDLELFRWIGANSFRTSHYPYSEEMMRLADRQGIVVIDETTGVGLHLSFTALLSNDGSEKPNSWEGLKTKEAHEQVIRELVARDKNHPSVVMWSVANEPASMEDGAKEYFEPLVKLTKDLDPQKRPVTIVLLLTAQPDTDKVYDLIDVICLNRYYGWYTQTADLNIAKLELKKEMEQWEKKAPGKPIMFTEYGADTVSGFHAANTQMFTEEYQVNYYKANHEIVDQFSSFIGEQTWNFADFETSDGLFRIQGNKKGIFTRDRKPKAIAHYFKERWHSIPDFDYKK